MALKGGGKFKGKLTIGLKNNIRNLANFHATSQKSENFHFYQIFFFKTYKDLDDLCFMTLKSDAKFEEKLTLVPKMTRNLVNFYQTTQNSKNSMGYFLSKVY